MQLKDNDTTIYPLTPNQIAVVKESQIQYGDGKYLTEEEANTDIEKWLEEYKETKPHTFLKHEKTGLPTDLSLLKPEPLFLV